MNDDTTHQYERISGNWARYFSRLCNTHSRRGQLTREDCLALMEKQEYRCALTGTPLTCLLKRGEKTRTNASIDRIDPKGSYHPSNIQIVCVAVNVLRSDIPLEEYKDWCRKVADYAIKE